jgi:hypothetical protein
LDISICVLNIYGPYNDRQRYWEGFFNLNVSKKNYVVMGGDLNFTWIRFEVWGPSAKVDKLGDYLRHNCEEETFIDVGPIKITPT